MMHRTTNIKYSVCFSDCWRKWQLCKCIGVKTRHLYCLTIFM